MTQYVFDLIPPPSAPLQLDLVSRDKVVWFQGAAPTGARVVFFANGVRVSETAIHARGTYSCAISLDDGIYEVSASVFTSQGALLFSTGQIQLEVNNQVDFSLDNQVDINGQPGTGGYVGNDLWARPPNTAQSLRFHGTIEAGGSVRSSDPNVTVDVLGTSYTVTYRAPANSFISGSQTFRLDFADPAGNTASKTIGMTVDDGIHAPTISPNIQTDPANKLLHLAAGVWRTQDATPILSGTADWGSIVQIMMDGRHVGDAVASQANVWTYVPASPIAVGSHTFSARVTNPFGSVAETNTIRVAIDPLSATVSMKHWDQPHDSAHAKYSLLPGALIPTTFASAKDVLSGSLTPIVAGDLSTIARVDIYDGKTKVGNATLNGQDWSYSLSRASAGDHDYSAKLIGKNGSVIDQTEIMAFTIAERLPGGSYTSYTSDKRYIASDGIPKVYAGASSNALMLTSDSAWTKRVDTHHPGGYTHTGGGYGPPMPGDDYQPGYTTSVNVAMPNWQIHGQAGNDLLVVTAGAPLGTYWGDDGFDTLRIYSPATPVAYQLSGALIHTVERVDMDKTGAVTLSLNSADVAGLKTKVLAISGDVRDVIHLQDTGGTHFQSLGIYDTADLKKLGKHYQMAADADLDQGRETLYHAYMVNLGSEKQTKMQDEFLLLVNVGVTSDLNGVANPMYAHMW